MRRSTVNLLALACLLYIVGWPSASSAQEQRSQSQKRRSNSPVISRSSASSNSAQVWIVELQDGEFRSTPEDAKKDVLYKACIQVGNLVRQCRPDIHWLPSVEYLKKKLRCSDPEARPAQDVSAIASEKPNLYTASVRLELTPPAREEMLLMVRLEEARDRQWVLAKGLMAVLALLLVLALYLRLTERAEQKTHKSIKSYMSQQA